MSLVQSKQEIWEEHIQKAKRHPDGITGYCREVGISSSGFYQWRKKIMGEKKLKTSDSFAPVEVRDQMMRDSSESKTDADWVGRMLASFVRELP